MKCILLPDGIPARRTTVQTQSLHNMPSFADGISYTSCSSSESLRVFHSRKTTGMGYVGSKRRIAEYILPFIYHALEVFPNGSYIEPFVGGCNMITQVKHHTKIGYDKNPYLIALLNEAKNNPDNLRQADCISRKAHKYVKLHKDEFLPWYVGAMGFLPTYSKIWMGSYYDDLHPGYFKAGINTLLKADLSSFQLYCRDYKNVAIGKGNVVYCDPPYKIQDYYGMQFKHDEFYEWVRRISRDNIVLISEYEMPDDFACIWKMKIKPGIDYRSKERFERLFIYKG